MVEDENLIYRSPSEMSNILNAQNLEFDSFNEHDMIDLESLELPISNRVDILPPEEGSITRYANIFSELDSPESVEEDFNNMLRDSHSDVCVYKYDRSSQNHSHFDDRSDYNDNYSDRSMTFSDRVVQERQRMIRKKLLEESNQRHTSLNTRMLRRTPRARPEARRFSLLKEDHTMVSLDDKASEKYRRLDELLSEQQERIRDMKFNVAKNNDSGNELTQVQEENGRLVAENEQSFERIRKLKMDIENLQSDLIIERKQNEQLLKDKIDLQNRVSLLSKENKSLLSSQEMMQNLHKNEVEELNGKKVELSSRITKLEGDVDYFRDNLQESHKINEMLKTEISSLIDSYKNEREQLQKLKIENKRLMENNSIYKSQNYSLIEINDRLRNRTLFRNHSGEFSTTNSSTLTNASSSLSYRSNSVVESPTIAGSNVSTNSLRSQTSHDMNYLELGVHQSNGVNASTQDSMTLTKHSNIFKALTSTENTPSSVKSLDNKTVVSNSENLDLVLSSITNDKGPHSFVDSSNALASVLCNDPSSFSNLDAHQSYNVVKIIREDNLRNPTTKWVADRVSRNSSVEALESLREKIRSISTDCNLQSVNINSSLKCFQSNVTINLIQNKLQLISQRLSETIV